MTTIRSPYVLAQLAAIRANERTEREARRQALERGKLERAQRAAARVQADETRLARFYATRNIPARDRELDLEPRPTDSPAMVRVMAELADAYELRRAMYLLSDWAAVREANARIQYLENAYRRKRQWSDKKRHIVTVRK